MVWKYIDRVGCELEGGWITEPTSGAYHHDGSVTVRAPIIGEFVSEPMRPEDILAWITDEKIYPPYINDSCGLHVHMSFNDNNDYARVMTERYFKDFGKEMKGLGEKMQLPKGHPFWGRLSGKNSYCVPDFNPDRQWRERGKNGSRYSQLNYCFSLHGTLECRLFPMFESRTQAGKAVRGLLDFTDKWIDKARKKGDEKQTIKLEIPLAEEEIIDVGAISVAPPPRRTTLGVNDGWGSTSQLYVTQAAPAEYHWTSAPLEQPTSAQARATADYEQFLNMALNGLPVRGR